MSASSSGFNTLIELLAFRADRTGDRIAFTYQGQPTTYSSLWDGINRFAAFLMEQGLKADECVVVALPNGPDFFVAFYGVQRAGGVAVPLFPSSQPERILQLAGLCEAGFIVLAEDQKHRFASIAHPGMRLVSLSDCHASASAASFPQLKTDDLAFLQYTSGSTGNPKGVMLSHANLLTNISQMIAGMQITERDVFVSWLPVYHDMGLILMTMAPFYLGVETHLLPADLGNVRSWLKTIKTRRGTFTAAPDFAYRLCIRYVDEEIDLSSLRVALNAAEPVRAGTIRDFEEKFNLRNVMTAGYGLAEATVGVSMSTPGRSPKVDEHGLVSVGHPFHQVEVQIVEGERVLSAGQVGEIAIRSAANCRGYYRNTEETKHLFCQDGFLLSGDLGYLDDDGNLFIAGRKKNILKHAGETVAAQEVEEIVDCVSGVRFSAAVGIDRGRLEGEQVYLFAEMRGRETEERLEETVLQIVESIHARLGFRPARVLLLKPHAIPRTYNGKIQHVHLKGSYLSGQLKEQGAILYPDY